MLMYHLRPLRHGGRRLGHGHVQVARMKLDGMVMVNIIQQYQHHIDERAWC
jgi:hypothetical protein